MFGSNLVSKLDKYSTKIKYGTEMKFNVQTVSLALSLQGGALCFAHPRTELSILLKFYENPSRD